MTFHPGLYCVSIANGAGSDGSPGNSFPLPCVQLAALPGHGGTVEILARGDTHWLFKPGDALVIKVTDAPRDVVLTSYRAAGEPGRNLNVQISRLDTMATGQPLPLVRPETPAPTGIRVRLMAHVQNHGDVTAPEGGCAGLPDRKVSIEGFAILPLDGAPADCIEYKGLSANGMETTWILGGNLCGSRGIGVPLVGLAIRLRGPLAEHYDCVYEVLCASGVRSPVIANGQPFCSDVVGDPIQAFTVRIVERGARPGSPMF
ncbi:hypothetical protein [Azospirillum halopraeferens]|uniref:hypothetical protein n=1 Tax=Azospirillum halopraeferens TaxID=34010 RepID=UPI0012EB4F67|nr:hypothetical protein [Azospirillum halopraeferens]